MYTFNICLLYPISLACYITSLSRYFFSSSCQRYRIYFSQKNNCKHEIRKKSIWNEICPYFSGIAGKKRLSCPRKKYRFHLPQLFDYRGNKPPYFCITIFCYIFCQNCCFQTKTTQPYFSKSDRLQRTKMILIFSKLTDFEPRNSTLSLIFPKLSKNTAERKRQCCSPKTSRFALGFMAHAGPQRRGIVPEHCVAKVILKQKKVPSNIEYINLKCRRVPITTQEAKS